MLHAMLWKDCIEIVVLTVIFYQTARWLHYDKQSKLLMYALMFAFAGLSAYLLELSTLTTLFAWYCPTISTLFILFHHKTLQRNFIALTETPQQTKTSDDWLEIIMSLALYNMHHARATQCIIQHTHELSDFVHSSFLLNTPIQQELLTILCDSNSYKETEALWIQSNGMLRGINTVWRQQSKQKQLKTSGAHTTQSMLGNQEILTLTTQTDALVFMLDPVSSLFTVIIGNTIFKQISAHHAVQLIKKHIMSRSQQKGILDEKSNRTTLQQHSP